MVLKSKRLIFKIIYLTLQGLCLRTGTVLVKGRVEAPTSYAIMRSGGFILLRCSSRAGDDTDGYKATVVREGTVKDLPGILQIYKAIRNSGEQKSLRRTEPQDNDEDACHVC